MGYFPKGKGGWKPMDDPPKELQNPSGRYQLDVNASQAEHLIKRERELKEQENATDNAPRHDSRTIKPSSS